METRKQQNTENDVELAAKLRNKGRLRTMGQVNVLLNGFEMILGKAVEQVFHFELKFWYKKRSIQGQPEPEPKPLERGIKNDESKETRRRLLWALFQQLFEQQSETFGQGRDRQKFVWDCATALYSPSNLGLKEEGDKRKFTLDVNRDALEERCSAYIRNMASFSVSLVRTNLIINLRNAGPAFIQSDDSVVTFLELLSSQRMFEKRNHFCFGNRFYDSRREGNIPMQDVAPVLKKGLQKNVRFVGDSMEEAQPILQIYPKKSAFFAPGSVINYLCAFSTPPRARATISGDDLARQLERPQIFQLVDRHIKGVVFQTNHLKKQMTFVNAGITDRPASELTFTHKGQPITIENYFYRHYEMRLRYVKLPCIIKRTPKGPGAYDDSYFPMEVMEICDGQLLSMEKQRQIPALTEQMIRQSQVKPADVPDQIVERRDVAHCQSSNPFFKAFEVKINPDQINAKANLLFPPAIQYAPRQECVQPNMRGVLDWKMSGQGVGPNCAYIKPADWPPRWAIVIVQNAISQEHCHRFVKFFVETARKRGIANCSTERPVQVRWDLWHDTSLEYAEEKFKFYRNNRCLFVLMFAPGKRSAHPGDTHHVLKLMEQKYDIVTQHISPEVVKQSTLMKMDNVLFKTNQKLGGINWSLITSNVYKQASGNREDVLANVWLGGKRMFIGLDWSHAPPLSLADRKKGKVPAIPTVIGMAYTMGKEVLEMRGTYWFQQPRQTTITQEYMRPFIDNIKEALSNFHEKNNYFPEHLIVFRGGASEGEFKRIAYWEGNSFAEAFKEISQHSGQSLNPAVTIVVCQRQSNYRIVPVDEVKKKNAKAAEQNVQPGTVLDKGIMNAALTEFLLMGHKAFQGTAQPIRCTVVMDGRPDSGQFSSSASAGRIPLDELENITYVLCYSHGICCMPTALPGPLHEAGELCKRGRNNWKTSTNEGDTVPHFDLPAERGDEAIRQQEQRHLVGERREYFGECSRNLKPILPSQFWA